MRPELVVLAAMLVVFAVQDLRTRAISLPCAALFGAAGLLLRIFSLRSSVPETLAGLLPGLLMLPLCFLTRGGIGTGDALAVLLMGLFLPPSEVALSFLIALALSALYAAGLLLTGRGSHRTSFPFLPFLLPGTLLTLLFVISVKG